MNKLFEYSILKYVHSPALGEELNLGILFYFSDDKKYVFKYPEKLNRIKNAFFDFQEKTVKEYLRFFSDTVERLNKIEESEALAKRENIFKTNLKECIDINFIKDDDSSLQFEKPQVSVLYADNYEQVANTFYDLYLKAYQSNSVIGTLPLKNEKHIISSFNKLIYEKSPSTTTYFKHDIQIGGEGEKTRFKADIFWQNGTGNCVKAVSFDLKDPSYINDKALLFSAKLSYLTKEIEENNYRVDLLVSSPSNESLRGEYENSLDILNDIKANKRIILESDFEQYAQEAIKDVKRIALDN